MCNTCDFYNLGMIETCHYFGTWGRKRPCLYADILVHPKGEEGGHGGLSNLLKFGEREEDWEEKKEDDDDEEEM